MRGCHNAFLWEASFAAAIFLGAVWAGGASEDARGLLGEAAESPEPEAEDTWLMPTMPPTTTTITTTLTTTTQATAPEPVPPTTSITTTKTRPPPPTSSTTARTTATTVSKAATTTPAASKATTTAPPGGAKAATTAPSSSAGGAATPGGGAAASTSSAPVVVPVPVPGVPAVVVPAVAVPGAAVPPPALSPGEPTGPGCAFGCYRSCAPCDSICVNCSFCNTSLPGPFGSIAGPCNESLTAQLDGTQRHLTWTEQVGQQSAVAGTAQVNHSTQVNHSVCHVLCYEVWASPTASFTTFAPFSVSGEPFWSLFGINEEFGNFKVRAVVLAEMQVARTQWSNVVVRVATVTSTTTTPTSTTTSTTGTTTNNTQGKSSRATTRTAMTTWALPATTPWTTPPAWMPTTFISVWASAAPTAPPSQTGGLTGIQAALLFSAPPGDVPRYASGAAAPELQAALASMLDCEGPKVHILSISAAQTEPEAQEPPGASLLRRLSSAGAAPGTSGNASLSAKPTAVPGANGSAAAAAPSSSAAPAAGSPAPAAVAVAPALAPPATPANTGAMRVEYVVECASEEERVRAVQAVMAAAEKGSEPVQRFKRALALGGLSVLSEGGLTSAMVDREWSSRAADSSVVVSPGAQLDDAAEESTSFSLQKIWPYAVGLLLLPVACALSSICLPSVTEPVVVWLHEVGGSRKHVSGAGELARAARVDSEGPDKLGAAASLMPEAGRAPNGIGFDPRRFDPRRYMTSAMDDEVDGSEHGGADVPLLPARRHSGPRGGGRPGQAPASSPPHPASGSWAPGVVSHGPSYPAAGHGAVPSSHSFASGAPPVHTFGQLPSAMSHHSHQRGGGAAAGQTFPQVPHPAAYQFGAASSFASSAPHYPTGPGPLHGGASFRH